MDRIGESGDRILSQHHLDNLLWYLFESVQYIGQTGRMLEHCLKEHKRAMALGTTPS